MSVIVLNFFALQAIPSVFRSFFTVICGPGQYKGPKYPSLVHTARARVLGWRSSHPRPAELTLMLLGEHAVVRPWRPELAGRGAQGQAALEVSRPTARDASGGGSGRVLVGARPS